MSLGVSCEGFCLGFILLWFAWKNSRWKSRNLWVLPGSNVSSNYQSAQVCKSIFTPICIHYTHLYLYAHLNSSWTALLLKPSILIMIKSRFLQLYLRIAYFKFYSLFCKWLDWNWLLFSFSFYFYFFSVNHCIATHLDRTAQLLQVLNENNLMLLSS